jgi:hypothetical protein
MTMPDMPAPPAFRRPVEPSWFDVVELMDHHARRNRDALLYALARQMGDLVDDHDNGDQGCAECGNDYSAVDAYCPRWEEAQHLMLGWLIDRAAI